MSDYKCFSCGKKLSPESLRKKVRCIYCGAKVIYKSRETPTKVKAR